MAHAKSGYACTTQLLNSPIGTRLLPAVFMSMVFLLIGPKAFGAWFAAPPKIDDDGRRATAAPHTFC
jgi:hypothetical protein